MLYVNYISVKLEGKNHTNAIYLHGKILKFIKHKNQVIKQYVYEKRHQKFNIAIYRC